MDGSRKLTFTDGFRKADQFYSKIVYYISQISPAFLIIIMFVAVIDTLCTKLFSFSIKNAYAVVQYFSIPNIYLSVATVQMTRGHTKMGMFQDKMPKIRKMLCRILANALGAAVCILMSYEATRLFITYLQQHTTSTTNGIGGLVLWPFVLCFLVGYILLTIAFIFCIFRAVLYRNDTEDTRSDVVKEADAARREADAQAAKLIADEMSGGDGSAEKGADNA